MQKEEKFVQFLMHAVQHVYYHLALQRLSCNHQVEPFSLPFFGSISRRERENLAGTHIVDGKERERGLFFAIMTDYSSGQIIEPFFEIYICL